MMQYYQELTLCPDEGAPIYFLWGKVFTAIHVALAEQKNTYGAVKIAVSFPQYEATSLGAKLRLLAEEEETLQAFDARKILRCFADYLHVTNVRKISPERVQGYAVYSRYQPDSSAHQKARRYSTRHPECSYEQALQFMKAGDRTTRLPYIQMRSMTNGNPFRLFIKKTEARQEENTGFSSYGLSAKSTVPEF